ncbi:MULTISPECIES: DUF2795 domain-containing protein [Clavibacter]|jgi:hypothetical protein|uniref:DUF2795 domain-containing protein n=2 Tax=Clavibacter TaxID=1573 RepID=A0A7L7Z1G2_9MICO|nr:MULTISPECIES: DUF2795 domain-containing protein [Clavibacter]MBM7024588.1 DUF2795 domain-containing protein [Clavibacter zhangzhiyongii]MDQ0745077.1 hypothetical protein [Clavibacter sp. B3I6]OQJ62747.1 hypothetical protein B5P24_06955 [Clavibacter michiganensis subsp. tessellarius]QOD43574.1 DUF2795 domain-containing protein [Clavibacter zhangzhiyongii]UKF34264.1 DUF2795 domain-containing protein [Clavibacter michiganensis subsp. tessellarius]
MAINPIELQKHLSGLDYPASKDAIVKKAEESGADSDALDALKKIEDKEYDAPTAINSAVSDAS